jgi:hypothetical protein
VELDDRLISESLAGNLLDYNVNLSFDGLEGLSRCFGEADYAAALGIPRAISYLFRQQHGRQRGRVEVPSRSMQFSHSLHDAFSAAEKDMAPMGPCSGYAGVRKAPD